MLDIPLVDLEDMRPDESLLADVRRTRITTPATRALLGLVVVAGAFLGGAVAERSQHKTSSGASSPASIAAQFRPGAAGGSGTAGASPFGAGGATIGTVKLVDGTSVYVQDAQGNTIKVTTSPSTRVTISKTGKLSELAPGSTIIVQGKQNSAGTSMSATSISPSAGLGGAGFGAGARSAG